MHLSGQWQIYHITSYLFKEMTNNKTVVTEFTKELKF